MRREILDQYGTVVKVLHTQDDEGVIETIEDVEPIIDEVKALRDDHRARGHFKHVARVPSSVVEQAMREGWFHDQARWNRWLNDGQNRDFRVWEGTV